jgi:hypothetical protein
MNTSTLKKKFEDAIISSKKEKASKKAVLLEKYISAEVFRDSLKVNFINRKDQKEFQSLYNFYLSFFCLPDETETFDGFEKTLELNTDKNLIGKYGKYEEAWYYLCTEDENEIIAGANFSVYSADGEIKNKQGLKGTVHITYIFVKNEYRNFGLAKYLLRLIEAYSEEFIGGAGQIAYFCEQNAPEMMHAEEYFSDNLCALVDQCDRLIWWDKAGYKRLGFNYIQPPLNPGQNPCVNLTLNVKSGLQLRFPAPVVFFHLERFFAIAVLKGSDPMNDSTFVEQMKKLEKLEFISLSGDQLYYQKLKEKIYLFPELWEPVPKLF